MRESRLLSLDQLKQCAQELANLRIDAENAARVAIEAERIYRLEKRSQHNGEKDIIKKSIVEIDEQDTDRNYRFMHTKP